MEENVKKVDKLIHKIFRICLEAMKDGNTEVYIHPTWKFLNGDSLYNSDQLIIDDLFTRYLSDGEKDKYQYGPSEIGTIIKKKLEEKKELTVEFITDGDDQPFPIYLVISWPEVKSLT